MAGKTNRKTQITIRIEPHIMEGLNDISKRVGIAPSTLAGLAIGEYVSKSQIAVSNAENMHQIMAKEMALIIGGPLASLMEDKTPEELREIFKDD